MSDPRVEFKVPVPKALQRVIRRALPPEWREGFEVLRLRDGMIVKIRDGGARELILEARRLSLSTPGFLRGQRLAYAYRSDAADVTNEDVERYIRVLKALCASEAQLLPFVSGGMDLEGVPVMGSLNISETQLLDVVGDEVGLESVVAAVRGFLHEHLHPQASFLDLYLENPCAQSCVFCVIPRTRKEKGQQERQQQLADLVDGARDIFSMGAFSALLEEAGAREPPPVLRIAGNDWARHPRVSDMLETLEAERDVAVRFLGPSTVLADAAFAARITQLPTLDGITVTLQSVDNSRHDSVVGQPGSAAMVKKALENLRSSGALVWVNVVLVRETLPDLSELLGWFRARDLSCALHVFVPDAHEEGWDVNLLPRAEEIRSILESLDTELVSTIRGLVGLPMCAVPAVLRQRLEPVWNTDEREPIFFPDLCDTCILRDQCSGVPESYRQHGEPWGLLPETGFYG